MSYEDALTRLWRLSARVDEALRELEESVARRRRRAIRRDVRRLIALYSEAREVLMRWDASLPS